MNPKEKAQELIDNYIEIMPCLAKQTVNTIREHAIKFGCNQHIQIENVFSKKEQDFYLKPKL